MSASLVGSEMCIRDSFREAGAPVASSGRNSGRSCVAWSPVASVRVAAPVSYTHLTLPTICSV
eukprot:10223986-Alexandrium_andersonii.AAC.1